MMYLTSPNLVVRDIRNQLEKVESQLQIATTEKTKLLDLLSAEKEEKRELKEEMLALMPPPEEREQKTVPKCYTRHCHSFI